MPFRSFFVSICKRKGFYYKSTDRYTSHGAVLIPPLQHPDQNILWFKKMFINFFQHFIFHYAAFIVKMSILQIKPLPDVRLGFVAGFIYTSRAFLCDTLFNNIFRVIKAIT